MGQPGTPSAKRLAVIAEARSWIGTPARHQGRLKSIACDCVGHIIEVPKACGLLPADFNITGYARHPDPIEMKKWLDRYLDRVGLGDERGGDVLWLKPRHLPQHLAIMTFDSTIIHAIDATRGVREHIFDKHWRDAVAAVYRYRGIDE